MDSNRCWIALPYVYRLRPPNLDATLPSYSRVRRRSNPADAYAAIPSGTRTPTRMPRKSRTRKLMVQPVEGCRPTPR